MIEPDFDIIFSLLLKFETLCKFYIFFDHNLEFEISKTLPYIDHKYYKVLSDIHHLEYIYKLALLIEFPHH